MASDGVLDLSVKKRLRDETDEQPPRKKAKRTIRMCDPVEKLKLIEQFQQQGGLQTQFAKNNGVAEGTFRGWLLTKEHIRKQVEKLSGSAAGARSKPSSSLGSKSQQLRGERGAGSSNQANSSSFHHQQQYRVNRSSPANITPSPTWTTGSLPLKLSIKEQIAAASLLMMYQQLYQEQLISLQVAAVNNDYSSPVIVKSEIATVEACKPISTIDEAASHAKKFYALLRNCEDLSSSDIECVSDLIKELESIRQ